MSGPRWSSPPPVYTAEYQPYQSSLKPYLTLPYLLSLSWVAYPILSVLFVAFRLHLSSASAQEAILDAKGALLSSCQAAEKAATVAASLPRYMASGTNKQINLAVQASLDASRQVFVFSLTALEGLIEFLVDLYRSTFLCFLELVIRGGLSILIGAVKEVTDFIQNTIGSVATSIQNDVVAANSVIASAVSGFNKIGSPFGIQITVPQFTVPSLSQLQNVKIPTDFQDALIKLNSTIPTLDDLREKLDSIISIPFEQVKKEINDTFLGLNFEVTPLPVPQTAAVTFCTDLDTGIVDDLGRDLLQVTKIGIILLIIVALLLISANSALTWFKWRCLQRELERTRQAQLYEGTTHADYLSNHNLLTLMTTRDHPLISLWLHKLPSLSPSAKVNLRFFFAYIFHGPALACFLIGLFGLLSVEIQLLAIKPIQNQYSNTVAASVADFSNTIATSMNKSMRNDSLAYATAVNTRIFSVENTVNNELFGWVNGTTTTLNNTLVTFYSEVQGVIQTIFGGTVLEAPAREFIRCILGKKVEAAEHVLTFLHDNLKIDVPKVKDDVLLLSNDRVNEVTRPISLAAVGSGPGDDDGGLVGRLVAKYVAALEKERIMMAIFLGIWGFIVICALMIIFWHSYVRGWLYEYKRRRWERQTRGGMEDVVVPWRTHTPLTTATHNNIPPPSSRTREVDEKEPSTSTLHAIPLHSPQAQRAITWDKLVGESSVSSGSSTSPTRRQPRKLQAFGMKALRKSEPPLVEDEDEDGWKDPLIHPASVAAPKPSWLQKLFGGSKSETLPLSNANAGPSTSRDLRTSSTAGPRREGRPKLTIDTQATRKVGLDGQLILSISPGPGHGPGVKPPSMTTQSAIQPSGPGVRQLSTTKAVAQSAVDPKRVYISSPRPLASKSRTEVQTTTTSSSNASVPPLRTHGHLKVNSFPPRPPFLLHPTRPDVPISVRSSYATTARQTRSSYSMQDSNPNLPPPSIPSASAYDRAKAQGQGTVPLHYRFPDHHPKPSSPTFPWAMAPGMYNSSSTVDLQIPRSPSTTTSLSQKSSLHALRGHSRTSSAAPRLLTIPQHQEHTPSSRSAIDNPPTDRQLPFRKYTNTPIRTLNVVNRTPSPTRNPFATPFDDDDNPRTATTIKATIVKHSASRIVTGKTVNPFNDHYTTTTGTAL